MEPEIKGVKIEETGEGKKDGGMERRTVRV